LNLHDLAVTRPSTLRVYQFRHQRVGGHCSVGGSGLRKTPPLLEHAEEHDRVDAEEDGDDHGQAREVALDDVRSALRGRREANPAEPRVAARVHQDERHEAG
jgi:hypothetical protein